MRPGEGIPQLPRDRTTFELEAFHQALNRRPTGDITPVVATHAVYHRDKQPFMTATPLDAYSVLISRPSKAAIRSRADAHLKVRHSPNDRGEGGRPESSAPDKGLTELRAGDTRLLIEAVAHARDIDYVGVRVDVLL